MTARKPLQLSFPDWVDLQVRTAQEQGAFENLPGKGKPIAGLDEAQDEMAWIVNKLRSENVDVVSALPPALRLAREVQDLPDVLAQLSSEIAVRAEIAELNDRIRAAHRSPQAGPTVRVHVIDVDASLERWRGSRPATAEPRVAPEPQPAPRPRGFWPIRRRGRDNTHDRRYG